MEVADRFFILPEQYNQCPQGVDEHEDDGDQTADPMNVKAHTAHKFKHHACAPGITYQPEDEEDKMPPLESSLYSFTPNTYGIKN